MNHVTIHAPNIQTVDPWHPVEVLAALRGEKTGNPAQETAFTAMRENLPWAFTFEEHPADLTIFPEKVWNPNTGREHPELRAWLENLPPCTGHLLLDGTCDREGPTDPSLKRLCLAKFKQASILRFGLPKEAQSQWETPDPFQEIEQPYWMERDANRLEAIPFIQTGAPPSVLFDGTIDAGPSDRAGFQAGFRVPLRATVPAIRASLKLSTTRLQGFRKGCAHKIRREAVAVLRPALPVETPHLESGAGYYQQSASEKARQFESTCQALEKHPYLLCIRGNGNYSIRFYYGLLAGRIPVVIDTGSGPPPLPTGWKTPITIQVQAGELATLPEAIRAFHANRPDLAAISRHNRECGRDSHGFPKFAGHLLACLTAQL